MVHVGDDNLVAFAEVCPIARLTNRMKEVAFMPNAISLASRAFTRSATLCRARATVASTSMLFA